MALTEKQREARIREKGEPLLRLEFDVFADGAVSMWTHFDHSADFNEVKKMLVAVKSHLDEFLDDEDMCPFHK
jgi:hypothetical protein